MKILNYLFVTIILMMSIDCDRYEYSGFTTAYIIVNESPDDIFYFNNSSLSLIKSSRELEIGTMLNNETEIILPSEYFHKIKIYKLINDDYVLFYEQNPIDNNLWESSEISENNFECKLIFD